MRGISTFHTVCLGAALSAALLAPTQGNASVAWKDGKAYTAMLADAAQAAANAVATAVGNLQAAKNALAAAQSALTGAGGFATSAAAAAAVANAQAAVATAQAAVAEATAGAPYVAGTLVAATGGTLVGQALRGLWSACLDPVCNLHASAGFSGYVPITAAQTASLIPTLSSLATGGAFALSQSNYAALGPAGAPAYNFLADGAALLVDTASGAAAVAAGQPAQAALAAAGLTGELQDYRAAIVSFATVLPTVGLTSPTASVETSLAAFASAVTAANAACDPGAGDNCPALRAALATATAAFGGAATTLTGTDFANLVGGTNPYIPNLTLAAFDAFLAGCASSGVACLPAAEIGLANALIAASDTIFDLPTAIAAYDATGDIGGEEAALFTGGQIDLAQLLLGSATMLSDCGRADCTWLVIDPFDSALIAEPSGWVLMLGGLLAIAFTRRLSPWASG